MLTLTDIYELLPQDVIDFENLNALPENSHGPMVLVMSYPNENSKSSVKMTFVGAPDALIPAAFIFSDIGAQNAWATSSPVQLDAQGNASDIYVECLTNGAIVALAGTLTNMITSSPDVNSITNPYDAIVSGEEFLQCVNKSTIEDPKYQAWADAMNTNQLISTREVITIMMMD